MATAEPTPPAGPAPIPATGTLAGLASWLRLVGRLQFLVLPLLFGVLPFTALRRAWGHDLLGGMFAELSAGQIFLTVLPLVLCAWSAMLVVGLLVEGSKLDPPPALPAWSRVFDVPPRTATFFVCPAVLAGPGAGLLIIEAAAPGWAILAALGAAVVAYMLSMTVAGALNAAQPGYEVAPAPLARWLTTRLARSERLGRVMRWLRRQASRLSRFPPFDGGWDPDAGQIDIDHFMAIGFFAVTLAVFLVEAYAFRPWVRATTALPSAALVFTLGTLLVWVVGALTFHLRRYRLSPVLALIVVSAIGYVADLDHTFQVQRRAPDAILSPAEVVRAAGDGNVVVVASAGGGIVAAGWTTLALQQLIQARPALAREIRLISGVSGGSVGAAFYLAGLREDAARGRPARALGDVLAEAHARSVASSLDAVAYGLVFLDFPRFLTGDIAFSWTEVDRGYLLEERWRNLAAGVGVSLHALAPEIRDGRLPAVIFNATAMETGRRVMVTPVRFDPGGGPYAATLDEYLSAPRTGTARGDAGVASAAPTTDADLDLWTAVRLSATFPYVSPAVRAKIDSRWGDGAAAHHMIDGGYNENYGVASVLDFLTPVMRARARGQLRFRRLLIVQLRAWNAASPVGGPSPAIVASLAGPLIGVLSVRDGATVPRNQSALQQFIDLWDGRDGVAVRSIVFEPAQPAAAGGADDEEPLSWHMTAAQKRALRNRWFAQTDRDGKTCAMLAFLDGRDPGTCGPSAGDRLEGADLPSAP